LLERTSTATPLRRTLIMAGHVYSPSWSALLHSENGGGGASAAAHSSETSGARSLTSNTSLVSVAEPLAVHAVAQ
jgi:hypothetical protein